MQKTIMQHPEERLFRRFLEQLQIALPDTAPTDLTSESLSQAFRYTFDVNKMTVISHIIEDTAADHPRADLHVSFQYMSRFSDQAPRYHNLVRALNHLWLYAALDAPAPTLPHTTIIDTGGSFLEAYWFVVAYGPGLSMTLLAKEIGQSRRYEGIYAFDHNITYKVLNLLHMLYPGVVPAPLPPELL
ncbi:MAG: hypothetical protein D6802_11205 [Ardenticatenia bacterium]|nr:MAG: hypothetical protein D6802_11205 [Ardenticatenia bacterium]